jgi:hypothetical protein
MKRLHYLLFALLITHSAFTQNIESGQFYTPINTGANMTLGINTDDLDSFVGTMIGAFNSQGSCIGLEVIQDEFFSMAIWGNDTGTPYLDGLSDGEIPVFAILTENGLVVSIAEVANFTGYVTNALAVSTSIALSGCTSDEYLEFHTQGYTADVDDGSCQTRTYTLDVSPELFNPIMQTDNNMVIGMDVPMINLFEGGTLGAFYDLDGDGILDCIDTIEIPGSDNGSNGFFTFSLWGDDQLTDEIDGLTSGQTPIFAILTSSNYVLAFESVPEFEGYAVNAFPTFTEIIFDLTIYGCMDPAYCNFNPDAEEDDGSCEGLPGCIDDHFVEFNENASCELEGACITKWKGAFEQLNHNLDSLTTDYNNQINTTQEELAVKIAEHEANINSLTHGWGATKANYMAQISNLQDSIANFSSPISIDILEGWNIIGFTLDEAQDAVATFEGVVEHILIVKNNNADVYWPEFGFNGIGDLVPGQGYQIKVTQAIDGFMYPKTNGQRIALTPSVPQWVIDMPVELHPNDIRSIVKVVNLLGQEVDLDQNLRGSTLIYLFSDGTVEKKLH